MARSLRRFTLLAGVVLLLASMPVSGGASTEPGRDGTGRVRSGTEDLFTDAGLDAYLRSRGLDPATAEIQRGSNNYAGPSCPGAGWTCTTAERPVVQVSAVGANVSDCSAPGGDVTTGPGSCTIIQVSASGDNVATCHFSTSETPATQTCVIDQTNETGRNQASVRQTITHETGRTQAATQTANVVQRNGGEDPTKAGSNDADITQSAVQRSSTGRAAPRSATQIQEAHQSVDLAQTSTAGANTAVVRQSEVQAATGAVNGTASITQRQNAEPGAPNVYAKARQASLSGNNALTLEQGTDQRASGSALAGNVTQVQSSTDGGLLGDVDQDATTGVSSYSATQDEFQDLEASTNAPGVVSQTQHGPDRCCLIPSITNTPDFGSIRQVTTQNARGGTPKRTNLIRATCLARRDGGCRTDSTLFRDGVLIAHAECVGSSCDEEIGDCAAGAPCTEVSRSPSSELHKAVRNATIEQPFGDGPEEPSSTRAYAGDTIEYRLEYHNHGDAPASHVTLEDPLPPHSIYVGCTGGCTPPDAESGTPVTWSLGTVAAGDTRVVTFRVLLRSDVPSGTVIPNSATAFEAGASRDDSNGTEVLIVPRRNSGIR